MTRLTALVINNPENDIRATFAGPNAAGKFSGWVEIWEGYRPMPRPLLNTEPKYATADEAVAVAQSIINELRGPQALEAICGGIAQADRRPLPGALKLRGKA